jgi:hypothetical protein
VLKRCASRLPDSAAQQLSKLRQPFERQRPPACVVRSCASARTVMAFAVFSADRRRDLQLRERL